MLSTPLTSQSTGDVAGSVSSTISIPGRDGRRGGERPSFLGLPLRPLPRDDDDDALFDEEDATD